MAGQDLAAVVTPEQVTRHGEGGDGPADRRDRHRHQGLDGARARRARRARLAAPLQRAAPSELLAEDPDAVFLANGPGDPAALGYVVQTVRELVGKRPVWGICLGHQLLCRAVGLETFKLPFGHRGANHPVKDLQTGQGRDHLAEPRLRRGRAGRRTHDRQPTSPCAGRPTSAPPRSRT